MSLATNGASRTLYSTFIAAVQLHDVYATRILARRLVPTIPPSATLTQATHRISYGIPALSTQELISNPFDGEMLLANATFSVSCPILVNNVRRVAFKYESSWALLYHFTKLFISQWDSFDEVTKRNLLEMFRSTNVPVNVWPYIRTEVHRSTATFGIPPIVLGVLRRA